MNIGKKAHTVRKLIGKNADVQDVIKFCESMNFRVIPYGDDSVEAKLGNQILNQIDLGEYSKKVDSFPFEIDEETKFLFVRAGKGEAETLVLLFHELGHILAGHVERGRVLVSSIMQEKVANEFVTYMTDPKAVQSLRFFFTCNRPFIGIACALVVCMIVLCVAVIYRQMAVTPMHDQAKVVNLDRAPSGDILVTQPDDTREQVVILLDGSTYYHKRDCSEISGKSGYTMPLEEAKMLQQPCPVCLP